MGKEKSNIDPVWETTEKTLLETDWKENGIIEKSFLTKRKWRMGMSGPTIHIYLGKLGISLL